MKWDNRNHNNLLKRTQKIKNTTTKQQKSYMIAILGKTNYEVA